MATYKCFQCGKKISHKALEKRFLCPTCGSKIFYKPRTHIAKVKAVQLENAEDKPGATRENSAITDVRAEHPKYSSPKTSIPI